MDGLNAVESFLAGEQKGFKAHVPRQVDVKAVRNKLRTTQAGFSNTLWVQPRCNQTGLAQAPPSLRPARY